MNSYIVLHIALRYNRYFVFPLKSNKLHKCMFDLMQSAQIYKICTILNMPNNKF